MLLPGVGRRLRPSHDGSPGDPNILYVGRWDRSDPADFHGYWSNVYLRTRFTGTSVGIKLDGGTRLDVCVDNEPYREMDAGSGVTALNTAPLKPGVHTLLVGLGGPELRGRLPWVDPGPRREDAAGDPAPSSFSSSATPSPSTFGAGNYSWQTGAVARLRPHPDRLQRRRPDQRLRLLTSKVGQDVQYFRLKNYNHRERQPANPLGLFGTRPGSWSSTWGRTTSAAASRARHHAGELQRTSFATSAPSFPKLQIVALRPFGGPFETPIRQAVVQLNAAGDHPGLLCRHDRLAGQSRLPGWCPPEFARASQSRAALDPDPQASADSALRQLPSRCCHFPGVSTS